MQQRVSVQSGMELRRRGSHKRAPASQALSVTCCLHGQLHHAPLAVAAAHQAMAAGLAVPLLPDVSTQHHDPAGQRMTRPVRPRPGHDHGGIARAATAMGPPRRPGSDVRDGLHAAPPAKSALPSPLVPAMVPVQTGMRMLVPVPVRVAVMRHKHSGDVDQPGFEGVVDVARGCVVQQHTVMSPPPHPPPPQRWWPTLHRNHRRLGRLGRGVGQGQRVQM